MVQLHKRFTDSYVKVLIEFSYHKYAESMIAWDAYMILWKEKQATMIWR